MCRVSRVFVVCPRAHEIAARFFKQTNGESQHQVHAVGNCHIDCGKSIIPDSSCVITMSNRIIQ